MRFDTFKAKYHVKLNDKNVHTQSLNAKAKDLFGWEPAESGVEGFKSGLKKTIDWFINSENLTSYKSSIYNI